MYYLGFYLFIYQNVLFPILFTKNSTLSIKRKHENSMY